MLCEDCQWRSALITALAPAISRLSFTRNDLLELLALPDEQLLRTANIRDRGPLLRSLEIPDCTQSVPTALCRHDPDYPARLVQLPCAPAVLYATCTPVRLNELLSAPTVAIVGSRIASDYAHQITSTLARGLAAASATIISGMNTGLEGTAHHHGRSIAVMPGGPEIPFPSQHERLQRYIRGHGAAVSEFPPGFCDTPGWCFIASQRIIAALASVIVVVESETQSCALFTAQIACDLGGDVAVVPGRVTDPGGSHTLALLRDGAHPVACAEDVLDLIGPRTRAMAA